MVTGSGLGELAAVAIVILVIPVGLIWLIGRRIAKRSNYDKWEPALEPKSDVHVLGSDLPQRRNTFFAGMAQRRYTVPKDPQAYAKIFVPGGSDKDREQ